VIASLFIKVIWVKIVDGLVCRYWIQRRKQASSLPATKLGSKRKEQHNFKKCTEERIKFSRPNIPCLREGQGVRGKRSETR
jgi:hypothetical protein